MKTTMHCLLFGSALAALSGCGSPMEWARPGATDHEVATAIEECRALAFEHEWREDWHDPWPGRLDSDSISRDEREPHPQRYQSSLEREVELRDFCMQSKGYQLRPAGQPDD